MDAVSESRLQAVNPALAALVRNLAAVLPFPFRVTQGLRTWPEQDALYAQGRTLPGAVVTEARGGQSWHNFGCAVDLVPMTPQPDWNVMHPVWQQMVAAGKELGLYSGSDFVCLKDYPHFQLTGRFPVTPDAEARQIYLQQGAQAFWNEVNANLQEDRYHDAT